MSLAILPSAPMPYGEASVPMLLPPAPSKRPKLTLKTTQTPTLLNGKGSTSLRLETLSAVSPTARNTFSNAYNPAHAAKTPGAKPQRPSLTPLATDVPSTISRVPTPLETDVPSLTNSATSSSAVSIASISTVESLSTDAPYKLSYNVTSILSNGPLPRTKRSRTYYGQSRPMFPAAKKVAFRAPLTEDIKNIKYTVAHSDIQSSASTISTLELPPVEREAEVEAKGGLGLEGVKAAVKDTAPTSPQTGEKRESSDEEDSDTCPATPVAGRRKKHRQWRWTLGPTGKAVEEVHLGEDLSESDRAGEQERHKAQ
ncbi:hypothetical protein LTR85_007686 [Meristemomyces frigidus]|nr:hypothetical protein LTR85_007686 [Meristemomyces frigidus]